MENKVSSSNPNVKSVTVPTAKKPVNSSQPKIIPVSGANANNVKHGNPKVKAQQETSTSNADTQELPKVTSLASEKEEVKEEKEAPKEEESPIEKIREDAEKNKADEQKNADKDEKSDEKKADAKSKEKIRIVIRDAKPPIAARILQGLMRVICLLLIVAVCGIGIPRLFGINEFNVLTGSMQPTYPVGSLVFVQPKDPSTIRPGEVVTCIVSEDLEMVTHRVMTNNYDDKTLTTKGDANQASDSPNLYENVVGVVVFSLPYVGGIVDYLTNDDNGRVLGIGGVLCILALTFIAEAICFLLTKQAASVYDNPDANKASGDGKDKGKGKSSAKDKDSKYEITSVNARKFNRQYRRGKGKPVQQVAPRDAEDSKHKKAHKHHGKGGETSAPDSAEKASTTQDAPASATKEEEPKKRGIA